MSNRAAIHTDQAPAAIGPYSQAIKAGNTIYLSGQIPLDPATMTLAGDDIQTQARQVFSNMAAVCKAAGGSLDDMVKVNLYLIDLNDFDKVNEAMKEFFSAPYPARAAIGISQLPKNSKLEAEGVMVLGD